MKTYSYNKELLIATAQFKDVFNNILIYRFDNEDNVTNTISVPLKYGAKSIALKSLENPLKNQELPQIAFNRSGFSVDPERVFNINRDILLNADGERDHTLRQPVAIDIQFELNIFSNNPTDDDQILQNFIPFSMPNFYVGWKHPYTKDVLKSQVIWSGDVTNDYHIDYDPGSKPRITSTTSFVYKTWIFAGSALVGEGRAARTDDIHTIVADYFATDAPLETYEEIGEEI